MFKRFMLKKVSWQQFVNLVLSTSVEKVLNQLSHFFALTFIWFA